MTSCVVTRHLVAALHKMVEFWSGYHALLMGEGRDEICRRRTEDADTAMGEAHSSTSTDDDHRMGRTPWMGAWISLLLPTVNGT